VKTCKLFILFISLSLFCLSCDNTQEDEDVKFPTGTRWKLKGLGKNHSEVLTELVEQNVCAECYTFLFDTDSTAIAYGSYFPPIKLDLFDLPLGYDLEDYVIKYFIQGPDVDTYSYLFFRIAIAHTISFEVTPNELKLFLSKDYRYPWEHSYPYPFNLDDYRFDYVLFKPFKSIQQ